jgi:hypothetical protein
MPYKDQDKNRAYHREYMRRKRADVKPSPQEPVKPHQEQAEPPQFIDRSRPYNNESRYPYPAYLVQDGFWFDPDTGKVVGEVKR